MKNKEPLIPRSHVVVLDLEFTQPNCRIIEIGAVIGDVKTGEIFGEFSTLVNPGESITEYIASLTGIDDQKVARAPELPEALNRFVEFLECYPIGLAILKKRDKSFITWGGADLPCLTADAKRVGYERIFFNATAIDLSSVSALLLKAQGRPSPKGLGKNIRTFQHEEFSGDRHRALEDARNEFFLAKTIFNILELTKPTNQRGIN